VFDPRAALYGERLLICAAFHTETGLDCPDYMM
jgi:hypothetical protein